METLQSLPTANPLIVAPHSLGKLIEWKPIFQSLNVLEAATAAKCSPLAGETN